MKARRFSIAGLLFLVLSCGIGLAALRSPSQLWAALLFSLALGTLIVSIVAGLITRERTQAYWIGFATCGLAYFGTAFGPWFADAVGPRLVTTALLDLLYPLVSPPGAGTAPTSPDDTAELQGQLDSMRRSLADPDRHPPYVALKRKLDRRTGWAAWTEPDRGSWFTPAIGRVVLTAPETFLRIGHSLIGLIGASAGGLLGRLFFDRRRDRRTDAAVMAAGLMLKVLEAGL